LASLLETTLDDRLTPRAQALPDASEWRGTSTPPLGHGRGIFEAADSVVRQSEELMASVQLGGARILSPAKGGRR